MPDEAEIAVGVDRNAGYAVIKLAGRCSAAICPGLRTYVDRFKPPAITDLYFDLSGTEWVDSTFIGLLVNRVRKQADSPRPHTHLVSPSASVRRSLESMHVLQLFDVRDGLPQPPTEWRKLRAGPVDGDDLGDMVIQAHESLIEADRRNAPTFGPVVDLFRAHRGDRRRKPD